MLRWLSRQVKGNLSRHKPIPAQTLIFLMQYGSPENSDLYIHRLGRTGRAGKQGRGVQVLLPLEAALARNLQKQGVSEDTSLKFANSEEDDQLLPRLLSARTRIQRGDKGLVKAAEGAYRSIVAHYCARKKPLKVQTVIDVANQFSDAVGLQEPPAFEPRVSARLGIAGCRGVSISDSN